MKKFFDYIQLPNFDIAADAAATFKVHFVLKNLWLQISYFVQFTYFQQSLRHIIFCCLRSSWQDINLL